MSVNEYGRGDFLLDCYIKEQLDFHKRLIHFRYESIKPKLVGEIWLELCTA
jgi:hypothetical protein